MAKHPAPNANPVGDLPPTPAELAEGKRIAHQHFRHILHLLEEAGRTVHPPRRRRPAGKIGDGDESRRALPHDPNDFDQCLSELAQRFFHYCKRPECRRAFQCRFGSRAGETPLTAKTWGRTGLPCLQQLPADVAHALHLMMVRQNAPQVFRERNNFQALERQVMRRAKERFGLGETPDEAAGGAVSRPVSADGAP
ncbi:hypothetical protein [Fulvimarina sp. MAC8]|uniref:hypothetical protein n=1 Tax=Fulvimarina sp. MAC8 TaxID=3162874 RepID=UPI0032EAA26A